MGKKQNPLSADARKALDLLQRNRAGDWFIFEAMEVVADGGVERAHGVLTELSQAGLGRIYDGNRRFALEEAARKAIATSSGLPTVEDSDAEEDPDADEKVHGRIPVAQLVDEAAAAGKAVDSEPDDFEPVEDDEAEPADNLTDAEIAALAEWKGGGSPGWNGQRHRGRDSWSSRPHFPNAVLLNDVLVELLALQLGRLDGLPGDPYEAICARLTAGRRNKVAVTRTEVRDAIAYCRGRGWLRTHRDYLMILTTRGRLIAYRLAPRRFRDLKGEIAYQSNPVAGTLSLLEP